MSIEWPEHGRVVAKALFGRPLRVALAMWVITRGGQAFYQLQAQQAMSALGESGSGTATELEKLVEHGMLVALREPGRRYFVATESVLWTAFEQIAFATELRVVDGSVSPAQRE